MNYLLDTHVCIWSLSEQKKLSSTVKKLLQDASNSFYVSKMSLFEIAIKIKIGKLPEFKVPFSEFVDSIYYSGYEVLPIKDEHLKIYPDIEFDESHRDPFDRYLLATATFENMAIITKDENFKAYKEICQIVW